jgi:hypothetical protein
MASATARGRRMSMKSFSTDAMLRL